MRETISKILLILSLSICLSTLTVVNAYAESDKLFCDSDTIQNFEDMGYDESLVYIKSDDVILSVDTWYDEQIYFDDVKMEFVVNNNYMVVGNLGEDGKFYINSYDDVINMYDYDNACILKITDDVPLKNKSHSYLSNSGITNDFMKCRTDTDNNIIFNICSLMFLSKTLVLTSFNNPVLAVLFTLSVVLFASFIIYICKRGFRAI